VSSTVSIGHKTLRYNKCVEGNPGIEKKKRSSLTEAAVLSVGLLSAHPEAQALELPAYTPWHIAIEDNVRQAVKKDKVEHATTYVQYTDRSGEWVSLWKGETGRVENDPLSDLEKIYNQKRGREIAATCNIHTHPEEIFGKLYRLKKVAYNPPSPNDMKYALAVTFDYVSNGRSADTVRFAVADPKGLWYFGPTREGRSMDLKSLKTLLGQPSENTSANLSDFIVNGSTSSFDFNQSLSGLNIEYGKRFAGSVRFVPYEKVATEPPCAGVHYKP
jgi:hypothetical protein